jgi:hypothetical protein
MGYRQSQMFTELCSEVAPEKWKGTRGKGADDELFIKIGLLHSYLKYHVNNPIEELSQITGASYEATRTRLRKAKKLSAN